MNQERINKILKMLEREDSVFLNYVLALEYQSGNQVQNAIPIFKKIIREDEDYLAAYFQLGKCFGSLGQKQEAISAFDKGIDIALKKGDRKTYGELLAEKQLLEE